jgi:exopolyphosphatase/guanosine-5'-triphosphate,3'-diphosphate pyrophosphatase
MGKRYAAADIGSNTVHLLVAEVGVNGLERVINQSEWLSLGEAVARTGAIPPDKQALLVRLLRDYQELANQARSEPIYVFATEAMRAAQNGSAMLKQIEAEVGLKVDLITPRQEAEFSLRGAAIDCHITSDTVLIEVGGGSAQIGLCDGLSITDEASLPIGTGKLIAQAGLHNPATALSVERARDIVRRCIDAEPVAAYKRSAIGSGGVIRGMWRALHPDGDRTLHKEEIEFLAWACARLSVTGIGKRFNVKPKRAHAMLAGALVYSTLMDYFAIPNITVSEYGVREGAIQLLAEGKLNAWAG